MNTFLIFSLFYFLIILIPTFLYLRSIKRWVDVCPAPLRKFKPTLPYVNLIVLIAFTLLLFISPPILKRLIIISEAAFIFIFNGWIVYKIKEMAEDIEKEFDDKNLVKPNSTVAFLGLGIYATSAFTEFLSIDFASIEFLSVIFYFIYWYSVHKSGVYIETLKTAKHQAKIQ